MSRLIILLMLMVTPVSLSAKSIAFNDIEAVATNALRQLQAQSIAEDAEYCGWVIYHKGTLLASRVHKGAKDSCRMVEPPPRSQVVASFHTHGSHDPRYYSEVPSLQDMLGDFYDETYGFIATPGGRIWLIDPFQQNASQLCGEGCLPMDKNYRAKDSKPIPPKFTPNSLHKFLVL